MILSAVKERTISNSFRLTYFNVVEYGTFAECLDRHLVSIWFGPSGERSIEVAKKKMKRYFETKLKSRNLLCGSCAEFFLHFYLGQHGYQQACLCSNLEENSIKKGFDGFYLKNGRYWLMESKSSIDGASSHLFKVEEAYRDLCHKINAFDENDPWENALNHGFAAGIEESILKQIKSLSDDFTLERRHDLKEFNMIPCGTVFIDRTLDEDEAEELFSSARLYFKDKDYASLHVVCVSHSALAGFLRYLGLECLDE